MAIHTWARLGPSGHSSLGRVRPGPPGPGPGPAWATLARTGPEPGLLGPGPRPAWARPRPAWVQVQRLRQVQKLRQSQKKWATSKSLIKTTIFWAPLWGMPKNIFITFKSCSKFGPLGGQSKYKSRGPSGCDRCSKRRGGDPKHRLHLQER